MAEPIELVFDTEATLGLYYIVSKGNLSISENTEREGKRICIHSLHISDHSLHPRARTPVPL